MLVPFLDLAPQHGPLAAELQATFARVLASNQFILGEEITQFEQVLAQHERVRHAIGVSSGTDALIVSLMALGIGPGDVVITTPFTFFATVEAIVRVGARPRFVDIDPYTFCLDPAQVLQAIYGHAVLALPVAVFGHPVQLPQGCPVTVLEDAAQAIGTAHCGVLQTLSFFPSKNLGALGDGGAVLTDDNALADTVRLLRNHGAAPKYVHQAIGGNFRLDALQAALLRVKLTHLETWARARRGNSVRYRELFAQTRLPAEVRLPQDHPDHQWNQFVIRTPRRDALRAYLLQHGIGTEIYWPVPMHLQPCFQDRQYAAKPGAFPQAEAAAAEVLALPIFPGLTFEQQAHVVRTIGEFFR